MNIFNKILNKLGLNIKFKLFISYGIILALLMILGISGIFILRQVHTVNEEAFENLTTVEFIAEKEKEFTNLMFIALFYMKNKSRLGGIKHTVLNNIKEVLEGKEIEGYPTLRDIQDRAEMYD